MHPDSTFRECVAESGKGSDGHQDGHFDIHNPGQRHPKK
jgi:hypothetical protein